MLTRKRKEFFSYEWGARLQHVRVFLCSCILHGKPDLFTILTKMFNFSLGPNRALWRRSLILGRAEVAVAFL